jgi:hypothetical protein
MSWRVGQASSEWEVAAKAALMYATALLALRIGERRMLAQWTIIDVATAVAMGTIIGRTAIAGTQSYLTGAVAVCTLVAIHRVASVLRFRPLLGKLLTIAFAGCSRSRRCATRSTNRRAASRSSRTRSRRIQSPSL